MTKFELLSLPSEVVPSLKKRMDKKMQASASGCVEWTGSISPQGYGVTSVTVEGKSRMIGAHRASWMLTKGPIPPGRVLDHLCRVRHCVNVEHLEPVMPAVNTRRGWASRRLEPPVRVRPPQPNGASTMRWHP